VTGPAPWGEALGQKLFPGEGLYAARGDIEPPAGNPPARPDQGDPGWLWSDREGVGRPEEALQRDLPV